MSNACPLPLVLVLALGSGVLTSGCDLANEDLAIVPRAGAGAGINNRLSLTFNTNAWVSAAARDVHEYWLSSPGPTNTYGYQTRLQTLTLNSPTYDFLETNVIDGSTVGDKTMALSDSEELGLELTGPGAAPVLLKGADLVGLELGLWVVGAGSPGHEVRLRITAHALDAANNPCFELTKIDPTTGDAIAPLCEDDVNGDNFARIYNGISIDGQTGEITDLGQGTMHHIACMASAPGKATRFGYAPRPDLQVFELANRVIRADYCADGHPYTYPGNLLGIQDNLPLVPGQPGPEEPTPTQPTTVEAIWGPQGVLCMGTPRSPHLQGIEVVCPVKHHENGTIDYNWKPPACEGFIDPNPNALRMISTTDPTAYDGILFEPAPEDDDDDDDGQ
ncbi:MAG: ADYC domain-containing protein [Myxococcota bacterium]